MPTPDPSEVVRAAIQGELQRRGHSVTPQALNALVYAATNSSYEVIGDSDSILLGLLICGSYTLDILRDSGADIDCLTIESEYTAAGYQSHIADGDIDPIRTLFGESGNFGRLLNRNEQRKRPIETADLLQEAISPFTDSTHWQKTRRFSLNNDTSNGQPLRMIDELHSLVDEILFEFCSEIWINPQQTLLSRTEPLSTAEIRKIKNNTQFDPADMRCIVGAINKFIQTRELPLGDSEFIDLAIAVSSMASIGSNHFVSGGGNYHDLSLLLKISTRYAPERDEPILSLSEENGRIIATYYSYRGTRAINTNNADQVISVNSQLVLPLISQFILDEFEALLNNSRTGELDIQRFLERHPEILKSLGYTECRPQVVLSEPGADDLKPDFILYKPGNSGFDILDLKLPTAVIARHNPYTRISHDITKAIGQLRAYRNYFQKPMNKDRFIREHGIEYFEPKLIVAIGRQIQYCDNIMREEIQQQTSGIRVLNYDELVAYAKTRAIKF